MNANADTTCNNIKFWVDFKPALVAGNNMARPAIQVYAFSPEAHVMGTTDYHADSGSILEGAIKVSHPRRMYFEVTINPAVLEETVCRMVPVIVRVGTHRLVPDAVLGLDYSVSVPNFPSSSIDIKSVILCGEGSRVDWFVVGIVGLDSSTSPVSIFWKDVCSFPTHKGDIVPQLKLLLSSLDSGGGGSFSAKKEGWRLLTQAQVKECPDIPIKIEEPETSPVTNSNRLEEPIKVTEIPSAVVLQSVSGVVSSFSRERVQDVISSTTPVPVTLEPLEGTTVSANSVQVSAQPVVASSYIRERVQEVVMSATNPVPVTTPYTLAAPSLGTKERIQDEALYVNSVPVPCSLCQLKDSTIAGLEERIRALEIQLSGPKNIPRGGPDELRMKCARLEETLQASNSIIDSLRKENRELKVNSLADIGDVPALWEMTSYINIPPNAMMTGGEKLDIDKSMASQIEFQENLVRDIRLQLSKLMNQVDLGHQFKGIQSFSR